MVTFTTLEKSIVDMPRNVGVDDNVLSDKVDESIIDWKPIRDSLAEKLLESRIMLLADATDFTA